MTEYLFRQAAEQVVDEKMQDPEWAGLITQTLTDLKAGNVYPKSYVDVLMQKQRGSFDVYEAYLFMKVHSAIWSGEVALFQIPVGSQPFRGKQDVNEVLSGLQFPFSAEYQGSGGRSDGFVKWEKPINAVWTHREIDERTFVIVPADECPLEVGTVSAYKTFIYLLTNRRPGVARWPRGQDVITVLSNVFYGPHDEEFEQARQDVYGDFHTLPNPWDAWNREVGS
jgi:hypothetical protein